MKATDQSPGAVLLALAATGRAAEEDDHVFIAVDAVRSWALEAGVEVDEWEDGYRKMLAYAEAKGWMNSDATAIKAHIEGR